MQRLVYSPRVYCYVKTDGTRAKSEDYYLDLSDYVVSGNTQRVLDAVSSAQLVLRNPFRIFTDPQANVAKRLNLDLYNQDWGHPVFHPMDEITIFASRFTNKPIQIFTGYLDKATIWQMYPGTITLNASCSLKRLLYTFWDPALPSIINFLQDTGWEYLPNSGSFANVGKAATQNLAQTNGQLNDGSITALIYKVLNKICNWDDSEILIEKLPPNIVQSVVKMYNAIAADNEIAAQEYNSFLQAMIGTSGAGSTSITGGQSSDSSSVQGISGGGAGFSQTASQLGLTTDQLTTAGTILAVANQLGCNEDLQVAGIYAGLGESTLNKNATNGSFYGTFQASLSDFPNYNTDQGVADQAFYFYEGGKGFQGGGAISAYNSGITSIPLLASTVEANGNGAAGYGSRVSLSQCQSIVAAYNGGNGKTIASANTGNNTLLASKAINSTLSTTSGTMTRLQAMTACANGLSGKYPYEWGGGHGAPGIPSVGIAGNNHVGGYGTLGLDCSGAVGAVLAAGFPQIFGGGDVPADQGVAQAVSAYATQTSGSVGITKTDGVVVFDLPGVHTWMMISGKAWGTDDGTTPTPNGAQWLPKASVSWAASYTAYIIKSEYLSETTTYNSPVTAGNTDSPDGLTSTTAGADTQSGQSAEAFAINLAVPSSATMAEALLLTGSKSLMNCVSIFPFIQQLMSAGLRSFCSLPNGTFFGFYPDYFGELWGAAKKDNGEPDSPYWSIEDIEIMDGSISLSDDALATHVYVVGDTVWPAWAASSSSTEQLANMIASGGVVTIENAFEAGFVNLSSEGGNKQLKGKMNAINFMKRYGARPYINEDANFVSNTYLEAFMAFQTFQLMWARQFQTEFSFTFMPELFPGGRVGFPDHGIQCYIDSVIHTFDYVNGFTTTAQLEAPSVLPGFTNTGISQGMVRGDLLLTDSSSYNQTSSKGSVSKKS